MWLFNSRALVRSRAVQGPGCDRAGSPGTSASKRRKMKFSFPVTCGCGESFPVNVSGTQFPKDAQCPKCYSSIWLVEPLGNVVGMAILGRAATECHNGDWTLAIVLGAMAV